MIKIPPLTAEERNDLELWTGVNDEDGSEDEDDYEKRFVEISSETMARADLQHIGGLLFSEGHDDIYQKLLLRTVYEGEVAENLKAMKGLHRSPRIPCTLSSPGGNGVVAIDLAATRNFLSAYFNYSFEFVDFCEDSEVHELFRIVDAGDECAMSKFCVRSLAAFRNNALSQWSPYFPSAKALPCFRDNAVDSAIPITELLIDLVTCPICLETMKDPATLACGHSGCKTCLERAVGKFKACPECKAPVPPVAKNPLNINIRLRGIIMSHFPEKAAQLSSSLEEVPPGPWATLLDAKPTKPTLQKAASDFETDDSLRELALRDPREFKFALHLSVSIEKFNKMDCARSEALAEKGKPKPTGSAAAANGPSDGKVTGSVAGLDKVFLQRLLRRGGVLMEDSQIYDDLREYVRNYLERALKGAVLNTELRGSMFVTADDVSTRLKDATVLGFGYACGVRYVWAYMIQKVLKQVHPTLEIDPKALSLCCDMTTFVMQKILENARAGNVRSSRLTGDAPKKKKKRNEDDNSALGYSDFEAGPFYEDGTCGPRSGHAHSVRLYDDEDDDDNDDDDEDKPGAAAKRWRLDRSVSCLNHRDMESAVRSWFPGELAKHAVSEGSKAVSKFKSSPGPAAAPDSEGAKRSMAEAAGLQNIPEQVALIAYRLTNDYPMTDTAAVYLAAIMEYMAAECLELAGNCTKDLSEEAIGCRQLLLAVRGDEELDTIFEGCIFREGGIIPHIHKTLTGEIDDTPEYSPFERVMFLKARAAAAQLGAPYGVFVDPRTGLHMGVVVSKVPVVTIEDAEFFPLPLLDALSADSQQDRRRMAEGVLTLEERAMMKAEGYVVRCTNEENPLEQGWGRQSLKRFHIQRMRQARWEQRSSSYIIPPNVFTRMCQEVGLGLKANLQFTAEAIEFLQTLVEGRVVRLAEESQLSAIHAKRFLVLPKDSQLVRRIRSERS